jgi:hypothetical protein
VVILRLILFILIGFFVWRIIRLAMRLLGGGVQSGGQPRTPDRSPEMPELKNIEDAEFEDLTPPPAETPPSKNP